MGGPGSGRTPKDKEALVGHGRDHDDPRYLSTTRGRRQGSPVIPVASPRWHATARSWYNSLAISGHSAFFEPSDWATAVAAAEMYNRFLRTDNASILAQFVRLTERLGCTEIDRKRARIELTDGAIKDVDKERAAEAVISWRSHLGVVRDTGS